MKAKKFINGKIRAISSEIGDTVSSIKENGLSIETHKYWQIIESKPPFLKFEYNAIFGKATPARTILQKLTDFIY